MKSTAILATALFLASAPSPDSQTISQISAGFLKSGNAQPLLAAEAIRIELPGSTESSVTVDLASENPVQGMNGQSDR